jgi:hypothetical protein
VGAARSDGGTEVVDIRGIVWRRVVGRTAESRAFELREARFSEVAAAKGGLAGFDATVETSNWSSRRAETA